jgi:hypothetical protein
MCTYPEILELTPTVAVLLIGVGNDPREDRYFSIPKQVSINVAVGDD